MQTSPTASDETGDTEREQQMSSMKEQSWIVVSTGTSLQGDMHKHIDFPNAQMALDYIRQMPYSVVDVSADVSDAIDVDWTDDGETKGLFDGYDESVKTRAMQMLDELFTNARNAEEEFIIDELMRVVTEGA